MNEFRKDNTQDFRLRASFVAVLVLCCVLLLRFAAFPDRQRVST